MATIGTRLFTWFKGEFVGADVFGNRYFREKGVAEGRWRRRWVLYKGRPEASKVPPDWHAWLHRTIETPPSEAPLPAHAWERAQHDRHPRGLSAAGPHSAWRRARTGDRRLRGLAAGLLTGEGH